jgi:hypothetical protein
MSIYRAEERNTPPCPEEMTEMGKFIAEMTQAGFAILECKSKAEAIEMARRFLQVVGGNGESEVRQMAEY